MEAFIHLFPACDFFAHRLEFHSPSAVIVQGFIACSRKAELGRKNTFQHHRSFPGVFHNAPFLNDVLFLEYFITEPDPERITFILKNQLQTVFLCFRIYSSDAEVPDSVCKTNLHGRFLEPHPAEGRTFLPEAVRRLHIHRRRARFPGKILYPVNPLSPVYILRYPVLSHTYDVRGMPCLQCIDFIFISLYRHFSSPFFLLFPLYQPKPGLLQTKGPPEPDGSRVFIHFHA